MIIKYIVKSHNDICRQNVVLTGLVTGRLAEAGLEAGLPVGVVPRGGVVLAGEMRGVVALGGGAMFKPKIRTRKLLKTKYGSCPQ